MKQKLTVIVIVLLSVFGVKEAKAQGIAVKTNLAGWAMLAPNIGVDLCVSECSSIEAIFYKSVADSWLKIAITKLKRCENANFTALQLGYRYWFGREPLNSLFCGVTATPARYDVKINDSKRKGDCLPFGVNIGYCYPLNDKINIEVSYGIGALYLYEDIFSVSNQGEEMKTSRHNMSFSPTNIEIGISYIIK